MTSRIESAPTSMAQIRSKPRRDPAMRGRSRLQGAQEEAELRLRLLRADGQRAEDPLLHVAPVDTDRAARDLRAVQDQIVRLGLDRPRIGVELVEVFPSAVR